MADPLTNTRETISLLRNLGIQWPSFGAFWRGGWRSTAAWVIIVILVINGAVLPLARLSGFTGEALDWQGIAALVLALPALAHYRSKDLQAGVTT